MAFPTAIDEKKKKKSGMPDVPAFAQKQKGGGGQGGDPGMSRSSPPPPAKKSIGGGTGGGSGEQAPNNPFAPARSSGGSLDDSAMDMGGPGAGGMGGEPPAPGMEQPPISPEGAGEGTGPEYSEERAGFRRASAGETCGQCKNFLGDQGACSKVQVDGITEGDTCGVFFQPMGGDQDDMYGGGGPPPPPAGGGGMPGGM